MCKILLPIKPKYAIEILNGHKKFEYRRKCPKQEDITTVIIYVTSPIMKILGEFQLVKILSDSPNEIWNNTSEFGCIDKNSYDKYFENSNVAYAYVIGNTITYEKPKSLKDFGIDYHPQSFLYIK